MPEHLVACYDSGVRGEHLVDSETDLQQVIQEACALIKQAGKNRQGKIAVSPEVAELLERADAAPRVAAAPMVEAEDEMPALASASAFGEIGDLDALNNIVSSCTKCPLAQTRTKTVFGTGNPESRLVFVGEAPGRDEDLQGKPFVGRAGQLLTDIIEKGMKLQRSDVYICNVLKCRPPENRNPLPSEVELCEPYLIRQLEIIRPRVICALGTYAAQTLLKTLESIGRLRGRWHFYHGIPLRATYHPAYLLRNPADKRKTWEDVLEVLKVYNGEFTPKPGD